ncbi:MAG: diguanylate cyclase [Spirochaetaceae bacterium]|nr:diguanylate cyclase [Spirochaetaceae bacterium]
MILDIRTLAIICDLVLFGSCITMFAFWQTYRDRPGTGYWVLSLLNALVGFLLISFRDFIPDFLSIIAANIALTTSFLFLYQGIREYLKMKHRYIEILVILISVSAGLIYFTYIKPSLSSRIIIMSLMYIIVSMVCVLLQKGSMIGPRRNAGIVLSILFTSHAAFMAARLVVTLFSPVIRNIDDFMFSGDFQAFAFIITLFFYSGLTFTFIWISYSSLESQRLTLLSAIEQAPTSIIISDSKGQIEYVNPAFTDKTGYSSREAVGRNTRFLKNTETDPAVFKTMWDTIVNGLPWHGEFHNRKKSGELYWDTASIAPVLNKRGRITHFVSVNEDITESKRFQEHLKSLANHDSLTGLPSRRLVLDRLSSAIELAERNEQLVGILFADLDNFKDVNDELGHEAGDEILKIVGGLLRGSLRKADTVARFGGDEFLIVLPQIGDRDGTTIVAKGMIDAIASSNEVGNIGLSVGIALYPEHGLTAKELIKQADNAMYDVKRKGRNSWAFAVNLNQHSEG